MKNRFVSSLALTLTLSALSSTVMADTASEVRQVILDDLAHANQELNQDPMRLSKDGSKEFFSSGGLLNHLEVVVLVEGQAAVAHFYQEAMMKPTGLPVVPNYRTRVTQIFVKEEGGWKIRAAHWSPLMGGAGTSQTVIK